MPTFRIVENQIVEEKLIYFVEASTLQQAADFVRRYDIAPHKRVVRTLEGPSYDESSQVKAGLEISPYELAEHLA